MKILAVEKRIKKKIEKFKFTFVKFYLDPGRLLKCSRDTVVIIYQLRNQIQIAHRFFDVDVTNSLKCMALGLL